VAKHLGITEGLIYLPGQPSEDIQDSDQPVPFRQRRYFFYLSGADFENCTVAYDIGKDHLTLFIPAVDPKDVIWIGPVPSVHECESKYDVDKVALQSSLTEYVLKWLQYNKDPKIYLLHRDQVPSWAMAFAVALSDPGKIFDYTNLQPAMDTARVVKSDYEISMIRRANDITAAAHRAVLTKVSKLDNETQIEAVFQAACVARGAKQQAYGIIAASGENSSTLHYTANNEPLKGRQLVCIDAGSEWNCYASDVTRTFPISGHWSKEAKEIYDLVQEMQTACIARIRPGVIFRELHVLSMYIAVKGLMKLGVLHNGTFGEVFSTGVAFYPHGLGHHLGLECHDVTAYQRLLTDIYSHNELQRIGRLRTRNRASPDSYLSKKDDPVNLSLHTNQPPPYTRSQQLQKSMVVTVEPGM
jgi:Xaa-Pro dipeptidase